MRGGIDDYLDGPPAAEDVWSVIEVADSSLRIDLGPKLAAYAAAGIPQYVVIDLVNDRVLIHEDPAGVTYSRISIKLRGDTMGISAGREQVAIDADRLLP